MLPSSLFLSSPHVDRSSVVTSGICRLNTQVMVRIRTRQADGKERKNVLIAILFKVLTSLAKT